MQFSKSILTLSILLSTSTVFAAPSGVMLPTFNQSSNNAELMDIDQAAEIIEIPNTKTFGSTSSDASQSEREIKTVIAPVMKTPELQIETTASATNKPTSNTLKMSQTLRGGFSGQTYISLGAGAINRTLSNGDVQASGVPRDQQKTALKMTLGTQLSQNLYLEGSLIGAQRFSTGAAAQTGNFSGSNTLSTRVTTLAVGLNYLMPIDEELAVHFKAGLANHFSRSKGTFTGTDPLGNPATTSYTVGKNTNIKPYVGIGFSSAITDTQTLHLDYEYYGKVSHGPAAGKSSLDLLSVSVSSSF